MKVRIEIEILPDAGDKPTDGGSCCKPAAKTDLSKVMTGEMAPVIPNCPAGAGITVLTCDGGTNPCTLKWAAPANGPSEG